MFQSIAVIFLAAFVAFGATMFAVTAGIGPFTPPAAAQVAEAVPVEAVVGPPPPPPPPAAPVVIPPLPRDPVLVRQLRILLQLPKGTDMMALAEGFNSEEQFVDTVRIASNLGLEFEDLKTLIVDQRLTLTEATHLLRPNVDAQAEVKRAMEENDR
jgi:hypothetical protein